MGDERERRQSPSVSPYANTQRASSYECRRHFKETHVSPEQTTSIGVVEVLEIFSR